MAVQHVTTINLSGAAGRKDEGRGDQRIGVFVPNSVLRMPVKHTQHPVMAGEIGKIPRHGSIGLPQCIGAIDQRDVIEFRSTDPFGLHDPKQAGIVQITFGFCRKTPQFFGL